MIEVRPIRKDETLEFLSILTTVFDLNYVAAKRLFYSDPFYDVNRKWALFDSGEMAAILTTVPLIFGGFQAVGIAGVGTKVEHRSKGYARKLLKSVLNVSRTAGEEKALLFAKDHRLYEQIGFEALDPVIRGEIIFSTEKEPYKILSSRQVERQYNDWSSKHTLRLRRDKLRWKYWNFIQKPCHRFYNGYLCQENGIIREVIIDQPSASWPVPPQTKWLGLANVATEFEIPIKDFKVDSILMGCGFTSSPLMFMTDQF